MKTARGVCLLATLLLALGCSRQNDWNVLVVTFDTTRADHVAGYGSDNFTPHLEALAAEGTLFANALATVPITAPSHSSLLTGKYPIRHGVRDNGFFVLAEEQTTLAEILSERGYRTGAAIASYPLKSDFGLDQGFDYYDDHVTGGLEDFTGLRSRRKQGLFFDERPAAHVNAALLDWLEEDTQSPFLAWAHYFDPHQPWEPRPPYDQMFVDDPYRAEIAYADESFGHLVGELKRLGLWERTIVVVAADHGEGLGEHRESTHSMLLYQSTLHVPLIVRAPEGAPGLRIENGVSLIDVVPTLLDLLGLDAPAEIDGISLAPSIRAGDEPPLRDLYAETLSPRLAHRWGELRALIAGDDKYIFGPRPELFDLATDPKETRDLAAKESESARELQRRLAAMIREMAPPNPVQPGALDEETRRSLEALGYLSSAAQQEAPIEERLRRDGTPPQEHIADVSRLSTAKDHLFHNRHRDALVLIERLLEKTPESPFYLELRSTAELGLGRLDAAADTLARIRETYPDPAVMARHELRLASAHLTVGGLDDAIAHATNSLNVSPTAEAEYLRASAYLRQGSLDEQVAGLHAALDIDPLFVAARVDLAIALILRDEKELGERHLLRAMEDYPFYPKTYFNYGRLALDYGERDEALKNFRRAVQLDPNYLTARHAIVAVLRDAGDLAAAREALAELHSIAPNSQEARAAADLLAGADS